MNIKLLENEVWWGGCVADGLKMPYLANSCFSRSLDPNPTYNQCVPLLLSSVGRFLYAENAFSFTIEGEEISISSRYELPVLYEGFGSLKGAYLESCRRFFPPQGGVPDEALFTEPQFNTWIEFIYGQNQAGILDYAKSIIKAGFRPGVLMIDCGWSPYNGNLTFDGRSFPDPKAFVDELHDMGFLVMLWLAPFISADTVEYRLLRNAGFLVKDVSGEPSIKHWWDGYSAVLDLTNPGAEEWLYGKLKALEEEYGVDGFKFDGGDAFYYADDDVTFSPVTPNGQCELWARFGLRFRLSEYRACWKLGGFPLAQRLGDKQHSWGEMGLGTVIPSVLAQGILGYAYTCPDMIGGGEYLNFLENSDKLDFELFVRYAQCSALMPMMQFSAAPWRVLDERHSKLCVAATDLRREYAPLILQLAQESAVTGEPIVRAMEYAFPHEGLARVNDQFMLGDRVLVAPVITKGAVTRAVALPKGRWRDSDGAVTEGGCTIIVDAPLDTLPIFTRLDGDEV